MLALADERGHPAAVKLKAKFPAGPAGAHSPARAGPQAARRLIEELHVDSLDALEAAASGHRIRELKGFGPKAEESILAAVTAAKADAESNGAGGRGRRMVLNRALTVGEQLLEALRAHPGGRPGAAGRVRPALDRQRRTSTSSPPRRIRGPWPGPPPSWRWSRRPAAQRGRRAAAHPTGLKIDLRIVAPDQFGNLLQHFTGSKEHNMALREAAVRKGLHVSEYGVTDD